jgi:hypothetical protein
MNKSLSFTLLILITLVLLGCEKAFLEKPSEEKPTVVFDQLWNDIDRRYAFFEYKNIDWNQQKQIFGAQIHDNMNDIELFDVLAQLMNALKDGHVNLISPYNVSKYEVELLGKNNYNERLVRTNYLSANPYQTGGLYHDILQTNIGYVRYNSFSDPISDFDWSLVIARYKNTKGLIIDMRQNGGGSVGNVFTTLSHFVNSSTEIFQTHIKNGPEHNNFTEYQKVIAEPASSYLWVDKPVVVLVDRGSYSATSFFALSTKAINHIYLVGDTTGGGLGAPTSGQLSNGWTYRFSASQTLSLDGFNWENGVPPDVFAELNDQDVLLGKDGVIEAAVELIDSLNRIVSIP